MKKNHKLLIFCTLAIWLLLPGYLSAQVTWENLFAKADKQYNKGKYAKALKVVDAKLPKYILKKLDNRPIYRAWLEIYKAQVYEAYSQYPQMEASMAKGLEQLEALKSLNLDEYSIGLVHSMDAWLQAGNYNQVQSLYGELEKAWEGNTEVSAYWSTELGIRLAELYIQREEVNKAKEFLENLKQNIVSWKSTPSPISSENSKYDVQYRNIQHARVLSLAAQVYQAQGEYKKADSAFTINQKQVASLSVKHPFVARFWMAKGYNALDSEDYKVAQKSFEQAQSSVKKYHRDFLLANFGLGQTFLKSNKEGAFDRVVTLNEASIAKYFPKQNRYTADLKLLNAIRASQLNNLKQAESDVESILEQDESILPSYNTLRLKAIDTKYQVHTTDEFNLEAAEKDLQEGIELSKKIYGESSPLHQAYKIDLAGYYLVYTDDFDQAKDLFESKPESIVFSNHSIFHKDYVPQANTVARYYEILDQYPEALELIQNGTRVLVSKFGERDARVGKQLSRQAEMQIKVGDYRGAESSMDSAMVIIRKAIKRRSPEYADALALMAKINGEMGLFDEAEKLLRTSNRIYRRLGIDDISKKARSVEEMAFLYIRIGEYAETEQLLLESVAVQEKKYGTSSRRLHNLYNQLGLLYLIKWDFKNAESYLKKSEKIAQKIYGPESVKAAETYSLLANLHSVIGDYELASQYIGRVVPIQEKQLGDNHVELGKSYTLEALINLFQSTKNIKKSEEKLEKAKKIMASNFDENHPMYAEVLKNQANLYLQTKKYEEARQYLSQANAIWIDKLGEKNINSAQILSLLGDVNVKLKKFDEAKQNYVKAESIYKKLLSKDHPDYVQTESKLGRMYYVSNELKEANRLIEKTTQSYLSFFRDYFPSLNDREKTKFWNKIRSDFEFFNSLAVKMSADKPALLEKMYDHQLATKAILLSSSQKVRQSILGGNDLELKNLFQEWSRKREILTSLLYVSEEELAESPINITELQNELSNLEKDLSERSDIFANTVKKDLITWKDVRNSLEDNEAAVEIIRYRQYDDGFTDEVRYAALIVSRDTRKNPELVLFEKGSDMESKYVRYYRNMVKYRKKDRRSYENFWGPISEKLTSEINTVYFSPDGAYNQINLNALRVKDSTFLIDQIDIRYVSNTKDIVESRKKGAAKQYVNNAILFGDPVFYTTKEIKTEALSAAQRGGGGFIDRLPGTAREVQAIQDLLSAQSWKVTLYQESKAEESIIKNVEKPRVLHIATHGFFEKNAEQDDINLSSDLLGVKQDPLRRSGLLAKGAGELLMDGSKNFDSQEGILTAYEALSMNLEKTELVILSACETGLGEVAIGEGVYGLQRSFLVAGADALIMSLFKVNDEVTQKLMVKFYQKWLKTGNKRKAFYEAQKEIKAEYPYPALWGAFNMIGVQ